MPHNSSVAERLLTIIELSPFIRRAEKLLTPDERDQLIFLLASSPELGDEIPGTGGVRKLRFAAKGKGKSGGVRVIYYFYDEENPLYAIFLYGKNEQANPSPEQVKYMAAVAADAKATAKAERSQR